MVGLYDYPRTETHEAFHLQLRVNLSDGGGGGQEIALVGTEGKMLVTDGGVRLARHRVASAPGYGGWDSHDTFDEKNRREYVAWYDATFADKSATSESSEAWYAAEEGYSDHRAHHANFIAAIRGAATLVEDPTFGLRAAAPALDSNLSSSEHRPVEWDPQTLQRL
jgi:hypothetical protein